jgi:alkaline phosphatase D
VKFQTATPGMKSNQPPSAGMQYFGTVKIDSSTQLMTVALHNLEGKIIYSVDLPPET